MSKTLHKAAALLLSSVLFLSLLAGCAGIPPASTYASSSSQPQSDALVIAEQGVFSAGGITLTSDGTFDLENQWEESGSGQTAHVDHDFGQ